MLRRWCIPLAGVALAGGALAASAPGRPQPPNQAHHPPDQARHARHSADGRSRPASNAVPSQNWSGYAAHGKTYTKISASWVEPTGHCTSSRTFSSFWVGLDGFGSRTVEQTGSEVDCAGGQASTSAGMRCSRRSR